MPWINSIKRQILVLLIGLTVGLTAVFSAIAVTAAFLVEDVLISKIVNAHAIEAERYYAVHGELPSMPLPFLEAYTDISGTPPWMRPRLMRDQPSGELFTADESHYHYRRLVLTNGKAGYLVAEVSALLVVTQQDDVFGLLSLAVIGALGIAIALAVLLSRRIVGPVLQLTAAVKDSETPGKSVSYPKLQFELGYLSEALENTLQQLNAALEREKAFSTNVSHELRTPLTVIKNSCSLIAQRGYKPEDVVSLQQSAQQMENTIEVLLALARSETLNVEPCNLIAALEKAILQCRSLPDSFEVHINISRPVTVQANPKLLELLFINLLINAAEHASEPICTVEQELDCVIFKNKIQAYPPKDLLQAGTKSSSSQGIGQGLYLIARIADIFGWQLEVDCSQCTFRVSIKP